MKITLPMFIAISIAGYTSSLVVGLPPMRNPFETSDEDMPANTQMQTAPSDEMQNQSGWTTVNDSSTDTAKSNITLQNETGEVRIISQGN